MSIIPPGMVDDMRWAFRRGLDLARSMPCKIAGVAGIAGFCLFLQVLLLLLASEQAVHRSLQEKTALQLEVLSGASDQDVSSLYAALRQHPAVADVRFTTREQVYAEQRKSDPEFIAFLERFQLENPFPDTLSIVVRSVDDYRLLEEFFQEDPWRTVVDPQFLGRTAGQEAEIRTWLDVLGTVRVAASFLLALGAVVLAMIVGRAIAQGRAVDVQSLLGAGMLHMVAPPFVAAILLLLIGVVAGGALLFAGLFALASVAQQAAWSIPFMSVVVGHVVDALPILFLMHAIAVPLIAAGAAIAALRPSVPAPTILNWLSLPSIPRRS